MNARGCQHCQPGHFCAECATTKELIRVGLIRPLPIYRLRVNLNSGINWSKRYHPANRAYRKYGKVVMGRKSHSR